MTRPDQLLIKILAVMLLAFSLAAVAQTPEPAAASDTSQSVLTAMSLGQIFIYFIVMLGPLHLLGPFARLSSGMDTSASRKLAVKGFTIACFAGLAGAIIGTSILSSWHVSLAALLIAAGLVLLLVALKTVLSQYERRPAATEETSEPAAGFVALSPLAFPYIITPYGIAALILLLAAAAPGKPLAIFGVFLAVMVLNLVAMFFAMPILKYGADILTILGAVFGVLQVALAIQMLLLACSKLGILSPMGG
jgi:multiple antibiotic resistance protein